MHRSGLACVILLLAMIFSGAGCGKKAEPDNTPFELLDNFKQSLNEQRKQVQSDIDAHHEEALQLAKSRFAEPPRDRYRLFAGEKPFTWNEFTPALREAMLNWTLKDYQSHTTDSAQSRPQGEALLKGFVEYRLNSLAQSDLAALYKSAVDAGCRDPRIQMIEMYTTELAATDEISKLLSIQQEMASTTIHPYFRLRVAHWLDYSTQQTSKGSELAKRRSFQNIEAVAEFLESDSQHPREAWREVATQVEGMSPTDQGFLVVRLWHGAKVDPWIGHLVAGTYFKDLAFERRGGRFASETTEAQWQGMKEASVMAHQHLLRAWQLAPDRPEAATVMISLAMSGQAEVGSEDDWFYEAVRGQADWEPAYGYYLNAILPRWGGSYPKMLALGAQCIHTQRYDTAIPGYILPIIQAMERELGSLEATCQVPGVVEISKEFETGLQAAVDKGVQSKWNHPDHWGYLVRIRVLSRDFTAARTIYEKYAKGQIGISSLGSSGLKSSFIRGLTFASTGPAQDDVAAFEDFLSKTLTGDPEDLKTLDEIELVLQDSMKTDTQPESQAYYRDIQAVIQQLRSYHNDEWVSIPFDETLTGVYAAAARIKCSSEGVLQVYSTDELPGIQIRPMAKFRPPFVCEAEFGREPDGKKLVNDIGVFYGAFDYRALYADQPMRGVILKSDYEDKVSVMQSREPNTFGWSVRKTAFVHMRAITWPHHLDLFVNRERIYTYPMPEGVLTDSFAVGEVMPALRGNQFQVRNLRIRRLPVDESPFECTTTEQMDKVLARLREVDPESPTVWYILADFQETTGKSYEALRSFEKYLSLNPLQNLPRYKYARCLMNVGRYKDAIEEYTDQAARGFNPMECNSDLGWIYATAPDDQIRNAPLALKHAGLAMEFAAGKQIKDWRVLAAMAAAEAESGKFDEARKHLDEGAKVAPPEQKAFYDGMLADVDARRPIRMPFPQPEVP